MQQPFSKMAITFETMHYAEVGGISKGTFDKKVYTLKVAKKSITKLHKKGIFGYRLYLWNISANKNSKHMSINYY